MDWNNIIHAFKDVVPNVDYWSLRLVTDEYETLSVREGVVEPPRHALSRGAHITFIDRGGMAYAATSDLTGQGLAQACDQARQWLDTTRGNSLFDVNRIPRPGHSGQYHSQVKTPWNSWNVAEKLDLLQDINRQLKISDEIVDWQAHLSHRSSETLLLTSDEIEIVQTFQHILPGYAAVANAGTQTQMRTGGGWGTARQGGLEQLAAWAFPESARRTAEEAIALLAAPECPTCEASLLLSPGQMMLQIHESIGHPLELDRILGDERNYAGTSFVSLDMFGEYRYGSDLLNITFDPGHVEEMASYGFDDEGSKAEKTWLIRNGILQRPLGGATSQARAGMQGVATARACDWNRPPIDRMANLNLEPGASDFGELVKTIEYGVFMDTNRSWSIDDSRNKFQFGCELGRLIENGELKGLVRNPNYRGISAVFWRNLAAVGDSSTFEILGTPYCGKGEPNQMIAVGHASPAAVFHDVEIFGGD